ncbi:Uncharacterised protein [uncultured archaeon]|nr:Uncharacterised protein [uncultured archaeon]
MVWQDLVIPIVNALFIFALIPQIYHGFKIKKKLMTIQTPMITFLGLYVLAVTFLTLNLYFSTVATLASATLWYILLLQTVIYR